MAVVLDEGGPFALTNLSIIAGYFPDTNAITISLSIGCDVNFIDAIGELVSSVCQLGLKPNKFLYLLSFAS
jgi:hypothetical protein